MTVYLFNTSIMPTPGLCYQLENISLEEAKEMCSTFVAVSAIGHKATADILSALLGRDVEVNRIEASVQAGDRAIILKMAGRPPEGKILSVQEMEEIGYTLLLATVHPADGPQKLPSEKWLEAAMYLHGPGTLFVPAWPGDDIFTKVSYIGERGSVEGIIIGDLQFMDRNINTRFAGGHAEIMDTAEKMGIPILRC